MEYGVAIIGPGSGLMILGSNLRSNEACITWMGVAKPPRRIHAGLRLLSDVEICKLTQLRAIGRNCDLVDSRATWLSRHQFGAGLSREYLYRISDLVEAIGFVRKVTTTLVMGFLLASHSTSMLTMAKSSSNVYLALAPSVIYTS